MFLFTSSYFNYTFFFYYENIIVTSSAFLSTSLKINMILLYMMLKSNMWHNEKIEYSPIIQKLYIFAINFYASFG